MSAGRAWRSRSFPPQLALLGVVLAVVAMVAFLLPGQLGAEAVAYSVIGLVMGTIVGLLPGAKPFSRLGAFVLGLLLAYGSYVVRGGLVPYTNLWWAGVVLVLLLVIVGIAALLRSGTWYAAMLIGVGTLYGVLELQFRAAPAAFIDTATLALVAVLFGSGLGFMISTLFDVEILPSTTESRRPKDSHAPEPDDEQTHGSDQDVTRIPDPEQEGAS